MFFKDETGTSIIEVMIAIMVFMIIMVGGLQYFTLPQQIVARKKIKRLAVAEAQRRMEALLSLGFTGVVTDSNETNTSVTLAGFTGNRNTTVTFTDDSADGLAGSDADSDTVDYEAIMVNVTWDDGNSQSVLLTTMLRAYGK